MAKKKETDEKYLYDAKKFCVPVTKIGSLESIQFVIDDFIVKKVTFCVDGSDDRWEVWRIEEEGDSDKIKKKDYPRKPKFLYINGKKIDYGLKK
ncbi:MAG: hypothetical protein H8E22_04590 [Candidatus Cloacimonetes bacterium]|nr:hypothetical protein [Candidatus Cloacimonadota bacterium]